MSTRQSPSPLILICPRCRGELSESGAALQCGACRRRYAVEDGVADLSEGTYYDSFVPGQELSPTHARGLELELEGSRRRTRDYYAPLIRRTHPDAKRILDCGCGNGVAVDVLSDDGYEAWGTDMSALRKWQWRERRSKRRLVVVPAATLPFPDACFDVVIASGLIEHIGVEETAVPRYAVRPLPTRDVARHAFIREAVRVTRPGGSLFIDCPNGLFPIDFWHGDTPGAARVHSPLERFLPTPSELRRMAEAAGCQATFLSPYRRLRFEQARGHWYGRALAAPATALLRLMTLPGLRWLAASPLNPFLVTRLSRPAD